VFPTIGKSDVIVRYACHRNTDTTLIRILHGRDLRISPSLRDVRSKPQHRGFNSICGIKKQGTESYCFQNFYVLSRPFTRKHLSLISSIIYCLYFLTEDIKSRTYRNFLYQSLVKLTDVTFKASCCNYKSFDGS